MNNEENEIDLTGLKMVQKRILEDKNNEILNRENARRKNVNVSSKRHIDAQKTKGLRLYNSKVHKKRKKIIKKFITLSLLTATVVYGYNKIDTIVNEKDVVYYEIKDGDNLTNIANKFGTSVDKIWRDNSGKIDVDGTIHPGDIIVFISNPKAVDDYKKSNDMLENKEEYYKKSK